MFPSIIDIRGFPGYYVTSDGRILHIIGNQLNSVPTHKVGDSKSDYIHLRRDGKLHHRTVDRLVLHSFVGPHEVYHFIRHADGDVNNSAIDNLAWAPYMICQDCAAYGEYCNNYDKCKILQEDKATRQATKPLTPAKQKLKDRMERIAVVANALDDTQIKPSLVDIIAELRKGIFPNEVHTALLKNGRTVTIQYVHKVMRMLESNDPRLYRRK